jgi:hypothetical protein
MGETDEAPSRNVAENISLNYEKKNKRTLTLHIGRNIREDKTFNKIEENRLNLREISGSHGSDYKTR